MGRVCGLFCGPAKKNELTAELTYWYGVDAGALSRERQLGLLANLRRIQAQQRIFDGRYDHTDYEVVYDLHLLAYGNEQLARRARLESLKQVVREETEAARIAMKR